MNGRSFSNPEAIKAADELLNFAHNLESPSRDTNFYYLLYSKQKRILNEKDICMKIFSTNFETAHQLLIEERQLITQMNPRNRMIEQVHVLETEEYIQESYNINNIYSSAYNYQNINYYISSPRSLTYNQDAVEQVDIIDYEHDNTVIQISSALESINSDTIASEITREECTHPELFIRECSGISYNPTVLNEIENLETSLISTIAYESPSNAIPGITDNPFDIFTDSIENNLLVQENILKHQNPFYKINNDDFQITEDGLIVIKFLRSKVKKSFIVLELARLEMREMGYDFTDVLEFFNIMEKNDYVVRKPKAKYSIFKFTNKLQY